MEEANELKLDVAARRYDRIYQRIQGYDRADNLTFVGQMILSAPEITLELLNTTILFQDKNLFNRIVYVAEMYLGGNQLSPFRMRVLEMVRSNVVAWDSCGTIFLDTKIRYLSTRHISSEILSLIEACPTMKDVFIRRREN